MSNEYTLLITHFNKYYLPSCDSIWAKSLINELKPEKLIELSDHNSQNGYEIQGKEERKFLASGLALNNNLFYSSGGNLPIEAIDLIKEDNKFVLIGGNLSVCLLRAYGDLIASTKAPVKEFCFCAETTFDDCSWYAIKNLDRSYKSVLLPFTVFNRSIGELNYTSEPDTAINKFKKEMLRDYSYLNEGEFLLRINDKEEFLIDDVPVKKEFQEVYTSSKINPSSTDRLLNSELRNDSENGLHYMKKKLIKAPKEGISKGVIINYFDKINQLADYLKK